MIKRMWKADRVFTFLFLLAFSMTFCTAYFGMALERGVRQTGQTVESMDYGYREYYSVSWAGTAGNRADIKLPEFSTGILSYGVLVSGEDIVRRESAYVIMEMNEQLLEPLDSGEGFTAGKEYGMPQCICGMAWMEHAKKNGERETVIINGRDCEVAGILAPNGFADSDERMFLYGPSLPGEFLEELLGMEDYVGLDYRAAEQPDMADIEKYEELVQGGLFEGEPEYMSDLVKETDGSVDTEFARLMPLFRKFFLAVLAFGFVVCVFLSCFWCRYRARQNMLKRVFGFSMGRIWLEGILETVIYEAVSVLLAGIFCLVYETVRGNAAGFFEAWRYGTGILGTAVLLLTLLIGAADILYLQGISPADALKTEE